VAVAALLFWAPASGAWSGETANAASVRADAVPAATPSSGDAPGAGVLERVGTPTPQETRSPDDESPAGEEGSDGGGVGMLSFLLLGAGIVVGGLVGFATGRMGRVKSSTGGHRASEDRRAGESATLDRTIEATPIRSSDGETLDRHLVDGLIASYDLSTTEAQRARILEALRRASVTVLQPEPGETFDPERHNALGSDPVDDPAQVGRIMRTERPGWERDGVVLRQPEVIVGQ
jgi:GrpE